MASLVDMSPYGIFTKLTDKQARAAYPQYLVGSIFATCEALNALVAH